jgi:type I restriction enzyme R subunit
MPDPEALAREDIDRQLTLAGWTVQDRDKLNLFAGPGVAIREVSIPGAGEADYLLVAGRKAVGIVEAKARGATLTGVEVQTRVYTAGLPEHMQAWRLPLPMLYESTGIETRFTNLRDPEPKSRRTFGFHRPETLMEWAKDGADSSPTPRPLNAVAEKSGSYETGRSSLAGRFQLLPAQIDDPHLWPAQRTAIINLEHSLKENRPRALIQMATGSGKTFTAISEIYRLIRYADAKRVLFLVDRSNLGRQTFNEFQQYTAPDDGRKFTELYNVQHLQSNTIDPVARVCITTIQRLYSILAGEEELDPALEEAPLAAVPGAIARAKEITYNPAIPIETFDIIVIDEAHRSIYNLWRQVLDYFDAYLIGLTATPNKQAFAFFNQNLVMEYTHENAVIDGVNVPFDVYPIRTRITRGGSSVEAGYEVDYRDKQTRAVRWEALDEDLVYTSQQLDREVVSVDQIRTVIRTFREKLFTEIFPGRTEVPKTLIFAKDDTHADDIVQIVREEFGKGNDFCQKITYRTTGIKPEDLLAQFRNNYNPRIVVTVDMIATGTDVKPIEIVFFMRTVKSRGYFEQMKGRGVRVMPADDLKRVTKDAPAKTHFVIVDAVGIAETEMSDTPPMERKRLVGFSKLIEMVAWGHADTPTVTSLAFRLSKLDKVLSPAQHAQIESVSGGQSLSEIVQALVLATDPDRQIEHARGMAGLSSDAFPDATQIECAREEMLTESIIPLASNLTLRTTLIDLQARSEQVIDTLSKDEVLEAGFSAEATERSRKMTQSFRAYLTENPDEITALQVLYSQPYNQRIHYRDIKALANLIEAPPRSWSIDGLWQAYQQLDKTRVRGSGPRVLTDLVSLIRFAMERDDELAPFTEQVNRRFTTWLATQEAGGRRFTVEQRRWLELIRDHIAASYAIDREDLEEVPFNQHGGLGKMHSLFGENYQQILDDLNQALAA